jgi:hypothetical protein
MGGVFCAGLVEAIAAATIVLIALTLHAAEFRRLAVLIRPVIIIALIPCLWMLGQIIPVTSLWLAHPVWESASTALGEPFSGAITADIGATLLSFARYSLALAIAIITTAVALDRRRAEVILISLTVISALIAAGGAVSTQLGYLHAAGFNLSAQRAQALDIAVVGLVLACAMAVSAYERYQMRRGRDYQLPSSLAVPLAGSFAAFLVCLSAILLSADPVLVLAAACGGGIVASALAIRQLRLGLWGKSGIAAVAIVGLVGFVAVNPANRNVDLTLALSNQSPPSLATAERMISDASWAGTGAGTFDALLPIYRTLDSHSSFFAPPPALATVAMEMGRPFLWAVVVVALIGAWVLFRRALMRGRDHYYASAGAGCIVAILVASFATSGILGLGSLLVISATIGLALAQSRSWSAPDFAAKTLQVPQMTAERRSPDKGEFAMALPETVPIWFRLCLLAFGLVLAAQAAWILPAEYFHRHRIQLPVDQPTSLIARLERENATRAATLAAVRGDLWAESAFTYAGLLWRDSGTELNVDDTLNKEALTSLEHALRYSPHRGDVWLVFAAMADRYGWHRYQPDALLKMSYYTAPNEISLLPLRVKISLRPPLLQDPEIRDMLGRDIRTIMTRARALRPALSTVYKAASVQGQTFVEHVVAETDSAYLATLRAGLQ